MGKKGKKNVLLGTESDLSPSNYGTFNQLEVSEVTIPKNLILLSSQTQTDMVLRLPLKKDELVHLRALKLFGRRSNLPSGSWVALGLGIAALLSLSMVIYSMMRVIHDLKLHGAITCRDINTSDPDSLSICDDHISEILLAGGLLFCAFSVTFIISMVGLLTRRCDERNFEAWSVESLRYNKQEAREFRIWMQGRMKEGIDAENSKDIRQELS